MVLLSILALAISNDLFHLGQHMRASSHFSSMSYPQCIDLQVKISIQDLKVMIVQALEIMNTFK